MGRAALIGGGLGGAVMLAGGALAGMRAVELYFAAVGLAVGFAYPLLMTLIGVRFASSRGTAAGLAGGAGALGGFVAPWLTGTIGERTGVGNGIAALALWSAALALAATFMRRRATPE
jgi:nitrate/nitrite transporter NarK